MALIFTYVFIIGLVVGSFLNVCIYRIPKGESIIMPPSHCTACGERLKAVDLIPVVSYVLLKGRCRNCGSKISVRYPLIEILTAGCYLLLYIKYGLTVEFISSAFLVSLLIPMTFIDLEHKIIPNGLVVTGIAGGAVLAFYNAFHPLDFYIDREWWNPLAGSVTASGFLFLVSMIGTTVYRSGDAMGMGDVKIFIPIGLFLGWKSVIGALFISLVLAALTSLILIITRKKTRKDTIPFGPFIAIATFIMLLCGKELITWYMGG